MKGTISSEHDIRDTKQVVKACPEPELKLHTDYLEGQET